MRGRLGDEEEEEEEEEGEERRRRFNIGRVLVLNNPSPGPRLGGVAAEALAPEEVEKSRILARFAGDATNISEKAPPRLAVTSPDEVERGGVPAGEGLEGSIGGRDGDGGWESDLLGTGTGDPNQRSRYSSEGARAGLVAAGEMPAVARDRCTGEVLGTPRASLPIARPRCAKKKAASASAALAGYPDRPSGHPVPDYLCPCHPCVPRPTLHSLPRDGTTS